ncbi:globin [Ostertagia ostertagi]
MDSRTLPESRAYDPHNPIRIIVDVKALMCRCLGKHSDNKLMLPLAEHFFFGMADEAIVESEESFAFETDANYSYRSLSEENALDKAACDLIKSSWNEVLKSANATGHHFGYFVFQRVFQKDPSLKSTFGLTHDDEISEIPDDHECIRHTKIFTNIIHLAAKNVDELEPQVAPAIFKYGERHYNTKASDRMTEENVRMVCAQVVCTVCDLLGDDAHPKIVEAWIEMMRYLGRKLLDGHEYAKLTAKHRISINRNRSPSLLDVVIRAIDLLIYRDVPSRTDLSTFFTSKYHACEVDSKSRDVTLTCLRL